tara:strand:- start:119 stop:346 length:228 start_codon:yes stop_codon:yes gene_type:complete
MVQQLQELEAVVEGHIHTDHTALVLNQGVLEAEVQVQVIVLQLQQGQLTQVLVVVVAHHMPAQILVLEELAVLVL